MKPSTKRQIKNGLRIGGGIGRFFIAAMLLSIAKDGLDGISGHLRLWPDGAIASGLIALAVVIMIFTARAWVLYIAGCFLFAVPKLIVVILSGKDFYSPHAPFSRLEAAELLLFTVARCFSFIAC